ncbi:MULTISPECIES: MOSC domain-containing protein [unclassified Bradyrhizobium]|uniref:MOSC domain-containing protein n=1 Tax=unclassified Bradyrhizobium TaxID=2631580 RepID=UPI00102E9AA9|nr:MULTISPECIES: MOSC domain-containing protein [unclassified Bradyrhizobium]MDI4235835.1 MOSC domain-containing protein [Bradyrhizobium sp. Arg237L]TAI62816.1 MOSC domain-containing protein [Bradyrhizobium sp. Leo170]
MLGLTDTQSAFVLGVFLSGTHSFTKHPQDVIMLRKGLGIDGDAHCGPLVRHRFDAERDPARPNLRQVHLIQAELIDDLTRKGFVVRPGDLGENISTRGIDLMALPVGTRLQIGRDAVVEIMGLRSCCVQIDTFQPGMLREIIARVDGKLVRKGGVMGIVVEGGEVRPDDAIVVRLPDGPFVPLEVV